MHVYPTFPSRLTIAVAFKESDYKMIESLKPGLISQNFFPF